MATKEVITKVWIEEGCIVCDACETAAPDVFEVTDDTCIIRPEALTPDFTGPRSENIVDAAEECPVDVIKFDVVVSEVSAEEAAAAPAPAAPTEAEAKPAAPAKSPEAPAPAKVPEPVAPAAKAVATAAPTSMAGEPDPAIAALLRAATSRGGNAGILRRQESIPDSTDAFDRKAMADLPPDARQTKVMAAARKAKDDPDMARRGIASGVALAIGWSAFGLGTGVAVGPAFARFMMPNVLEEPDPRVRVGKVQRYLEMQPGDVIEDYKPQGIWMIRDGNRIAALSIICTHLGCIPNWLPNDLKFKCPCHGSGYLPDGINFEGPTPRPLERFRLFVDDGVLIVDKSKKYQYELGQWDQPGSFLEV
ncbi:MAG: Rieske 2Fe-2S domain-containing protein [Planctomycetes bacterium]|nr:Rieske 2Fe-2S domain-containing protein [Planctomycetota bacterium]